MLKKISLHLQKNNFIISFKSRIIASICIFIGIASLLMAYLMTDFFQSRMEPTIGQQHTLLLQGVARHIDQELEHRIDELNITADLVAPAVSGKPEVLRQKFSLAPSLFRHFWNVFIIDPEGKVLVDLRGSNKNFNVSDRDYFKKVKNTKSPVVSDPIRGVASGKTIAVIAVPVIVDGEIKAIIAGGIDLTNNSLGAMLTFASGKEQGILILVGANGLIISHPNPELIFQKYSGLKNENSFKRVLLKGDDWNISKDEYGKSVVSGSIALKKADWTVWGSYPYQDQFSAIATERTNTVIMISILALTAGTLGAVLAYQIISPMQRLRQDVNAIEKGDLSATALRTYRKDEIGELQNQFYDLVVARDKIAVKAQNQELFTRTLLTSAPDAVVLTNVDGIVLEWNARAIELFGWSRNEALGQNVADLIIPASSRNAHLLGMQRFKNDVTDRVPLETRLEAQCKDGSKFTVDLSLAKIRLPEGVTALAFIRDVTHQIEREHRIILSESRLQMIADNVPALIAYINSEEKYVFSNAQYKSILGVESKSIIGCRVKDVLSAEVYKDLSTHIGRAIQGENIHFEFSATIRNISYHFMADFIADLVQNDGGFYALITNITERKESELRQAANERAAAAASRAKSDFVANISHEIRTPMNAVLGIAQLLENTNLQQDQREYVGIIRASGLSLIAILNDVLDFSKIESGVMEIEHERFDIESIIDSMAAILSANSLEKDIDVLIGIGADVPRYIYGDFVKLQQVVTNLISNAIKFTHDGFVSLCIEVCDDGASLQFVVCDTGIGMTSEQLDRVFDSFRQADASTTRKYGGTGLGLSISRRLTELLGGKISVTSAPSEGSMFVAKLPLDKVTQEVILPNIRASLLLIDGSERSRQLFVRSCAYCGFVAHAYVSLSEALSAASMGNLRIELITHILISSLSGDSIENVKNKIRAFGVRKDIDIYETITPFARNRGCGFSYGNNDNIIQKPITPKVLRKLVDKSEVGVPDARSNNILLSNLRILIVEDNPINQLITKAMLANRVGILEVVNNGLESVQILRERPNDFDIILMDVQMPVMDGYEATSLIRNELKLTIPIVAMTAGVFSEEVDRCAASGMSDFLPKPIVIEDLFSLLNRIAAKVTEPTNALFDSQDNIIHTPVFSPVVLQTILNKSPAFLDYITRTVRSGILRTERELLRLQVAVELNEKEEIRKLMLSMSSTLGNSGAHRFTELVLSSLRNSTKSHPVDVLTLRENLDQFIESFENWISLLETKNGFTTPDFNASLTQNSNIPLQR